MVGWTDIFDEHKPGGGMTQKQFRPGKIQSSGFLKRRNHISRRTTSSPSLIAFWHCDPDGRCQKKKTRYAKVIENERRTAVHDACYPLGKVKDVIVGLVSVFRADLIDVLGDGVHDRDYPFVVGGFA